MNDRNFWVKTMHKTASPVIDHLSTATLRSSIADKFHKGSFDTIALEALGLHPNAKFWSDKDRDWTSKQIRSLRQTIQ